MAVPRSRMSNSRKNTKRAHHAKTPINFATCSNCSSPILPHHACDSCGQYKGRSYKTEKQDT